MADREHRIRERAHALWESAGKPHGQDRDHWSAAEEQVDREADYLDEVAPPAAEAPSKTPRAKTTAAKSKAAAKPKAAAEIGTAPATKRSSRKG